VRISVSATTAYSVFSAVSSVARCVTWPSAPSSSATRPDTAAGAGMARIAQATAVCQPTSNSRSTKATATALNSASARLVAASPGLRLSQRRCTRLPISNSSRPRARSVTVCAAPPSGMATPWPKAAAKQPASV
jgi:hypothetical protein